MSIVPNERLQSADSLELITFGIQLPIDSALQSIDTWSRLGAFWKGAVIRNLQGNDIITFLTSPNGSVTEVFPNSELPIKGWGSYFEARSGAATPKGVVEFECVSLNNALRRIPNAK